MDLRISYNWLKEYCDTKLTPEELAKQLSLHSFNVERIHNEAANLDKVVVGVIKEVGKHPNADKLRVTQVDAGQGRDLKIVCGAPNIYAGMKVIVALVGAQVKWHGEGELVELKPAKIRGEDSEGMICGANEVGLTHIFGDDKNGVPDLKSIDAKPGTHIAKALNLDDAIYDMEITSNRPDALGIIGLAREAAAVTGSKFLYKEPKAHVSKNLVALDVEVDAKELCPRYTALVLTDVKIGPSPMWLQKRLMQVGLRPINNVVDITNYVLLEHGQPMHAFDYDKITGQMIKVRRAKKGEKIKALDGKEYELTDKNLVIADDKRPVAVAGVMGGEETAVSNGTTKIVLESAVFDPVSVRRTARALNLHSDSSARFEKNLSTENCEPALWRAAQLVLELAGGKLASEVIDVRNVKYKAAKISLDTEKAAELIGVKILPAKIKKILQSLGFEVMGAKTLSVTVPYWRQHDVENDRDLVEEVARLYGYHNLPSELPAGKLPEAQPDRQLFWESKIKYILSGIGLTETYSYSFVSEKLLTNVGLDPKSRIKLYNPLNEDMVYMRGSLLPSLMQIAGENEGLKPDQSLFELSNVYAPRGADELPDEISMLSVVLTGKDGAKLFSAAKGIIEHLFIKLGVQLNAVTWQPFKELGPFQAGASSGLVVAGKQLGGMGLVRPEILAKFKIKNKLAGFSIDVRQLAKMATNLKQYKPLAKYPSVNLDIAAIVAKNVSWLSIQNLVKMEAGQYLEDVEVFDVYEGKGVPEGHKSVAFHIIYRATDKTLSLDEAQQIQNKVVKSLEQKLKAQVRTK